VEADHVAAYARAIDADLPAYFQECAAAPPMYGVVFQFMAMAQPLLDGELGVNVMRLVHGEQDMRFVRLVQAGDVIQTHARVENITDKTSGELLEVGLFSDNQRGERVLETRMGLFIRGRTRGGRAEDRQDERAPAGPCTLQMEVRVRPDQSLRYADASGDHNPIHKDAEMAKAAGLPDVILHGLCTMAFVQNAVIDRWGGRNPGSLRRLRVRFAKPVLNGELLSIRGWEVDAQDGGRAFVLNVLNGNGAGVVTDALAVLGGL
jgi:acyl dehydratase